MPTSYHDPGRRSVLLNFKFLGVSLVGSLTMALVSTFTPLDAQMAVLGACVSILAGLFVAYIEQDDERERRRAELLEKLQIPVALAPHHDLFDLYSTFAQALGDLARQPDAILRQFAVMKLSSIAEQVRQLADGRVVFTATETWRTVYEQLLQSPGLQSYRSVAWVKAADYWQDQPGRQSMRLNYHMIRKGLAIERIIILRGALWQEDQTLPSSAIGGWIHEQHEQGVRVSLVRESALANEPDLLCDFGVYDDRAAGVQEQDEQSRTQRFVLSFDRTSVRLAGDRWSRLALYATPYAELLNRLQEQNRREQGTEGA